METVETAVGSRDLACLLGDFSRGGASLGFQSRTSSVEGGEGGEEGEGGEGGPDWDSLL